MLGTELVVEQTYMNLATERSEEVTQKLHVKELDIKVWIQRHNLHDDLRKKILLNIQHILEKNRDIDVENPLPSLSTELRKDIKHHLCLPLLKTVPQLQDILSGMPRNRVDRLYNLICEYLKPVYYNENSYIVEAGKPLDAMLFITYGTLLTYTTSSGSIVSDSLEKGRFFGEELLEWGFNNVSPSPSLSDASRSPAYPASPYLPKLSKPIQKSKAVL